MLFEVNRAEIRTDILNKVSRKAIERLGATARWRSTKSQNNEKWKN
jgi:RimJ/RimL family protein N-acetyltransferase